MREIKFRGKELKSDGRVAYWVYGSYAAFRSVTDKFNTFAIINDRGEWTHVEPSTVGQYTGLKDKNGKEIYEGDIIKHCFHDREPKSFTHGVVVWVDELAGWGVKWGNSDCMARVPFDHHTKIGNIHDNPELLKENRCEYCGGSNIVTVNVGDEARKKCNDCENFLD